MKSKSAMDVERDASAKEEREALLPFSDDAKAEFQTAARPSSQQGIVTTESLINSLYFDEPAEARPISCMGWSLMAFLLSFTVASCYFLFHIFFFEMNPGSMYMFNGNMLRSNGTHDYKRTVLLVSIDGLRADYLDRGLTPNLLDISKKGLRAKSMRPIFPTLTFPNHWTLMTGLYAESHGIVANSFWDPVTKEEFQYNVPESAWKAKWWLGEPMWETAQKAGITTANLMFIGPPVTINNGSSKYFIPWRDQVPLDEKLAQIFKWIDLPLEDRPQLITVYEPSLDQAGHTYGPNSPQVNASLVAVDTFAAKITAALEERHLTDIVDVIFVSDHGMTDTSHPKFVYLEDLIGLDGIQEIEHVDGWPAMGLRFHSEDEEDDSGTGNGRYLNKLLKAVKKEEYKGKLDVYTKDTMPTRWHFVNNERIAPVWVVPKIGYEVTTRAEGGKYQTKGNHGFDNAEPAMHAVFVAHGPFSHQAKFNAHIQLRNPASRFFKGCRGSHNTKADMSNGWHTILPSQDTYIIDTFQNVELYNLVMKLLGVEEQKTAPTNGTVGFWDQYLSL